MSARGSAAWEAFRHDRTSENFQPVYDATKSLIYTICIRILRNEEDARDAFQSAYCRLFAMAAGVERAAVDADVIAVASRIAVREAENLRNRRRRRGRRELNLDTIKDASETSASARDAAVSSQAKEKLKVLISTLPDRYRVPIELHYYDGLSQREIARALGRSEGTVNQQVSRGLKKLRPLALRAGLEGSLTALTIGGAAGLLLDPPATLAAGVVFANAESALLAGGTSAAAGSLSTSYAKGAIGGLIMKSKVAVISLALIALAVGGAGYWWTRQSRDPQQHLAPAAKSPTGEIAAKPSASIGEIGGKTPALNPAPPPSRETSAETAAKGPPSSVASQAASSPSVPPGPMQSLGVSVIWEDSGEGVKGALVTMSAVPAEPNAWQATGKTDELGGLFLDYPVSWKEGSLAASAPGAAKTTASQKLPTPQTVVLKLPRGQTVFGVVRFEKDKQPAPGAHVVAYDADALYRNWEATADADGRYEIAYSAEQALVAASLGTQISVIKTAELKPFLLKKGERHGPHDLFLQEGLKVSGFVRDSESHLPISGAKLQTRIMNSQREAISGSDGAYRLEGLYERMLEVTAKADGYSEGRGQLQPSPDHENKLDIDLDAAGSVEISVADTKGNPVEDAPIWADGVPIEGFVDRVATTDSKGHALYEGVSRRKPPMVYPRKPGYKDVMVQTPAFKPGETKTQVAFVVEKSDSLKEGMFIGSVTDSEGNPIARARIVWEPPNSGDGAPQETATDGEGNYRFDVKPADLELSQRLKRLEALAEGWSPQWRADVQPGPKDAPTIVNFKLDPAHWIEVEAVDKSGAAIPGLRVGLALAAEWMDSSYRKIPGLPQDIKTDSAGMARVEGLPSRHLNISLSGRGWSTASLKGAEPDTTNQVVVRPQGRIRGLVVDEQTQSPVQDFTVKTHGNGVEVSRARVGEKQSAPEGRFELKELNEGEDYELTIESPGYLAYTLLGAKAIPTDDPSEIRFELTKGSDLSGRIVDAASGAPLVGAMILYGRINPADLNSSTGAFNLNWSPRFYRPPFNGGLFNFQQTESAADGSFKLQDYHQEGVLLIKAEGHGRVTVYPTERRSYALTDGVLQIPLGPAARVHGFFNPPGYDLSVNYFGLFYVVAPGRAGIAPPILEIMEESAAEEKPRFGWENLSPGSYELLAIIREPNLADAVMLEITRRFDLTEGEDRAIDLASDLGSITFRGKLRSERGEPMMSTTLTLKPLFDFAGVEYKFYLSNIPTDGSFKFPFLKAGPYSLQMRAFTGGPGTFAPTENLDIKADLERDFVFKPQ